MKVAINGFGRIGKLVFRAFLEKQIKNIDMVAINELGSLDSSYHLLKFDSTHGKFPIEIKKTKTGLKYKNINVTFFSEKNAKNLPWKKLKIDVILECSGVFSSKENLSKHWNNTTTLEPEYYEDFCFPCHKLHYGFNTCHRDDATGGAMCASNIKPETIVSDILGNLK